MKRPLAVIGFSFTAAAAVAFLVGAGLLHYLIIAFAVRFHFSGSCAFIPCMFSR